MQEHFLRIDICLVKFLYRCQVINEHWANAGALSQCQLVALLQVSSPKMLCVASIKEMLRVARGAGWLGQLNESPLVEKNLSHWGIMNQIRARITI